MTEEKFFTLPNGKISNVFEAYMAWKSRAEKLEAKNERLLEFCIMLRESIEGGGRVVTFQDIDVEFLEALGEP